MTVYDLNIDLEKLQSESVNNGGIFRFIKLPVQNEVNLKESFENNIEEAKLISVFNERTKEFIGESIEHWSLYSGPCPERTENSKNFDSLKVNFVNDLFRFIDAKGLIDIYRVENSDFWLNEIIESGIDHMNEDFIFHTKDGNYILHLGFSS